MDPFAWPDLLGVCPGLPNGETCDRRRGDLPLRLHPARSVPDVEKVVRFQADGKLLDGPFAKEAREVLGLDQPLLVLSRREAIDGALETPDPQRALAHCRREGALPEFVTVIEPILVRRVARAKILKMKGLT
jgi:hypothetical protein